MVLFSQGAVGDDGNSKLLTSQNVKGGVDLIPLPKVSVSGGTDRNATTDEVISMLKDGKLPYGADDIAILKTTKEQDAQIAKNADDKVASFEAGKESYNLYYNNCVDGAQDITQKNTNINLPNDFDPRPNSYWPLLKNYTNYSNSTPQEKDKAIDKVVKQQREEMSREPKY